MPQQYIFLDGPTQVASIRTTVQLFSLKIYLKTKTLFLLSTLTITKVIQILKPLKCFFQKTPFFQIDGSNTWKGKWWNGRWNEESMVFLLVFSNGFLSIPLSKVSRKQAKSTETKRSEQHWLTRQIKILLSFCFRSPNVQGTTPTFENTASEKHYIFRNKKFFCDKETL